MTARLLAPMMSNPNVFVLATPGEERVVNAGPVVTFCISRLWVSNKADFSAKFRLACFKWPAILFGSPRSTSSYQQRGPKPERGK